MKHNNRKLDQAIADCFCGGVDFSKLSAAETLDVIREAFKGYSESHLRDALECLSNRACSHGESIQSAAGLSPEYSLYDGLEAIYQPN